MMLNTGLPATFSPDRPSPQTLYRMTALSSITRTSIATTLSQAHGPFLIHLQQPDQIRILSSLASLYSCLGFKRKEALVLREVQAAVMDLIVCARDENRSSVGRESMSSNSSAGFFDRERDSRNSAQSLAGALGVREIENVQGNASVVRLVKYIAEVYGVDISQVKVHEDEPVVAVTNEDASPPAKESLLVTPRFGWSELQVGVVREAIAIAEALPGIFTLCLTSSGYVLYSPIKTRSSQCHSIRAIDSQSSAPLSHP